MASLVINLGRKRTQTTKATATLKSPVANKNLLNKSYLWSVACESGQVIRNYLTLQNAPSLSTLVTKIYIRQYFFKKLSIKKYRNAIGNTRG